MTIRVLYGQIDNTILHFIKLVFVYLFSVFFFYKETLKLKKISLEVALETKGSYGVKAFLKR